MRNIRYYITKWYGSEETTRSLEDELPQDMIWEYEKKLDVDERRMKRKPPSSSHLNHLKLRHQLHQMGLQNLGVMHRLNHLHH